MITGKIDVSKIDKSSLFKGAKGTYLDIVLKETPDSKYGEDYMIVQSVSQEDRKNGIKGAILGNAKIRGSSQPPNPTARPSAQTVTESPQISISKNLDEDVPF